MTDTSRVNSAPPEDPLSADRRTLAVAAAAMVAFILIGLVSAAIVTRSACAGLEPSEVAVAATGPVAEVAADLDDGARAAVKALLARDDLLGEPLELARVDGAERLLPVDGGVVAAGPTLTLLSPDGRAIVAAEAGGHLVGGGPTLFNLALTNELTGQTDALLPLNPALQPGECADTATVGTPLTFLVGALDGQLALFRVEEDSDEPRIELRDGVVGARWVTELEVGFGQPGVLAERFDGAVGGDLVVVGRRGVPDEPAPLVQAFRREDGTPAWQLHLDDLTRYAPVGDGAVRVHVLGVDADLALLAIQRDGTDQAASILAVDAADGQVRWEPDTLGLVEPVAAVLVDDVLLVGVADDLAMVWRLAREDGVVTTLAAADRTATAVAAVGERVLVGRHGSLDVAATGQPEVTMELGDWEVRDLLVTADRLTVLMGNGDAAVAVTFAR